MSGWFGRRQRQRGGYFDYGQHVRREEERIQQVLMTLIGINVAVFVLWQLARGSAFSVLMHQNFTVSAQGLMRFRFWTLLTSEFSHYDVMHLFFNMFGLWVFGKGAAEAVGWRDLLNLYLVGAVAASAAHVLLQLATGSPSPALGASGAVSAIAVMYALLFPNRTLLLNFFIPVPAWVAVGGYLALDLLGAFGGSNDNVAHAAHLGGAAWGAVLWWWRSRQ